MLVKPQKNLSAWGQVACTRFAHKIAQKLHKKYTRIAQKIAQELHKIAQAVWSSSRRFHCALCNTRRCYLYYLQFGIHGFVQVQISGMSTYLLLDLLRFLLYVSLRMYDDILEYSRIFVNISRICLMLHISLRNEDGVSRMGEVNQIDTNLGKPFMKMKFQNST